MRSKKLNNTPKHYKSPKKFNNIYSVSLRENIKITEWVGNGINILLAFIYLTKKFKNVAFLHRNLLEDKGDIMWKLLVRYTCYKKGGSFKMSLPVEEEKYFKEIKSYINKYQGKPLVGKTNIKLMGKTHKIPKVRFIIFGLYLGDKTCNVTRGHFNLAIMDIHTKTIERYEPYGYEMSDKLFEGTFDKDLEEIFKKNGLNYRVIPPSEYMTKKSFQYIEEYIQIPKGKGKDKKDDPFGFCGPWAIWFASLRLRYPNLTPTRLLKKAELILKTSKKPYRDFIRNYSQHYLRKSKEILGREEIHIKSYSNSLETKIESVLGK